MFLQEDDAGVVRVRPHADLFAELHHQDWPKIVTLAGSPPNAAMFRCTHWSDAMASISP
jgi:hypothetical protein